MFKDGEPSMKFRIIMKIFWILAIVIALISSSAYPPSQAIAETKVLLSTVITDEMYALIRQTDIESMDIIIEDIMERENLSRPDAVRHIRRYYLAFAEFDIDEDGTPELITFIAHSISCGSAGCGGEMHEKVNGKWVMRGGIKIYSLDTGSVAIIDDRRWHHYAPAHPKFKALQEKYGK